MTNELISEINRFADNCCDIELVRILRASQTKLRRLAAIEAEHKAGAYRTIGGAAVYADIRGRLLQELLYGDVDES